MTFLGVVVLLIGWIPTDFFTSTEEYRQMNVAEEFDASDVEFYNNTWAHYLNNNDTILGFRDVPNTNERYILEVGGGTFGGWDIDWCYSQPNKTHHTFYSIHMHTEYWGIISADHKQEFYHDGISRGEEISAAEIDSDRGTSNFAKYRVECDHFTYYVYLGYNSTKYGNATLAWNQMEIMGVAAIQFDEMNTAFNAWSVLSALLWFQLPGMNPYVNALIAIPIYASIIILAFIVIMRILDVVIPL